MYVQWTYSWHVIRLSYLISRIPQYLAAFLISHYLVVTRMRWWLKCAFSSSSIISYWNIYISNDLQAAGFVYISNQTPNRTDKQHKYNLSLPTPCITLPWCSISIKPRTSRLSGHYLPTYLHIAKHSKWRNWLQQHEAWRETETPTPTSMQAAPVTSMGLRYRTTAAVLIPELCFPLLRRPA